MAEQVVKRILRIGTRGSKLALWQAEHVASLLRAGAPEIDVEIVQIRTSGDIDRTSPLAAIGGTGAFTKEIERALLDRTADVAVHSLKDLPTFVVPELTLAAVPLREDVSDALVAPRRRSFEALPQGARIGTSSLRRSAILQHKRPDLRIEPIRGNVETRLNLALDGKLDAVVLAYAGLSRLGLARFVDEKLEPPEFLPAVGQGALGIECRADDEATKAILSQLIDRSSFDSVIAERRLLAELEGGCLIPLAAWGRRAGEGVLALDAALYSRDGRERIAASAEGPTADPDALGLRVAQSLREQGAESIVKAWRDA